MPSTHRERHGSTNTGWLRAAVMGANDGIVSTSSLIVGVAAAQTTHANILIAGVAGLVSGAMSMAAGEYISVSSQKDAEHAAIRRERTELAMDHESETEELTNIYVSRGLDYALAEQVAQQLMRRDPLGAHTRDELGITETNKARPLQAAVASAATFALGAALPLMVVMFSPMQMISRVVAASSLISLALLGALAARTGGASMLKGAMRVTFWSALAMVATAAIGTLFR